MGPVLVEKTEVSNGQHRSITVDHLASIPRFIWIAEDVAEHVYQATSHDRLQSLRLHEIGEMVQGPEPMLKVVWEGKWNDGHRSHYRFIISQPYAEQNPGRLESGMEHRLMREVFSEDMRLVI